MRERTAWVCCTAASMLLAAVLTIWFHDPACTGDAFPFLNPRIACGASQRTISKRAYSVFETDLRGSLEEMRSNGDFEDVAVYFRDLEYGPIFGINDSAVFSPASLLKLPVALTFMTLAERPDREGLLSLPLRHAAFADDVVQTFPPPEEIEPNVSYRVDELLRRSIAYSDNRATEVLLDYLQSVYPDEDLVYETITGLGIVSPDANGEDVVSVRGYASMFTQLYHSSYFEHRESSERVLSMLAESSFDRGLASGVPAGTKVAHKFGERGSTDSDVRQLHDCGIVYYPGNPYLLCVMTRGNDFEKLADVIAEVSRRVYDEVDSRRER